MYDRLLTDRVKSQVLKMGMDIIGFGPVERWSDAPFLLSPQAVLPGSKTVIVAGIHITDTWTEMGGEPEPQDHSPGGWMDQNSLLDRVAYRTVRLVEEAGYNAVGVASSNIWRYRAFEGIPSLFAPDLSHMHAAVAAGLAEMGWTGLAICPEFGPRVRYISIVTDALLTPTPMYEGPALCDKCMDCVRSCPSAAMRKDMNGKPHRVEIGGKVFEYANKNIWRCAWAEHFDLDLNSKTLEQDHIDESTVMNEVQQNGRRGHERGVCQKVCVPPHLRSDVPSFGRTNKLITLNRINRRYPETMPTLRKMRDDVMAKMIEWGADLTGVAVIDRTSDAFAQIEKEAPGMQRAIALAVRLPRGYAAQKNHNSYSHPAYQYAADRMVHHILLKAARMIEDYGYHAAAYGPCMWEHDRTSVSAALAEMAGLGTVKNNRFLSDEFGEDVIVGAIATDAPLDRIDRVQALQWTPAKPPVAAKLRFNLEKVAEENLASLFGVAEAGLFGPMVEDLKANINEEELGQSVYDGSQQCPRHGKWESKIENESIGINTPDFYLPGAKAVIVLGMHFPAALVGNSGREDTKQIGTYGFWNYQTVFELRFAALQIARELDRCGYRAFISENLLGVGSKVDSPRGLLPDARCNAIEAMAAGLGELGENGSLLTKEYGPHQRLICIVTDAALPADKPYHGDALCTHCGDCRTSCTMQALTGGSFHVRMNGHRATIPAVSRHRCDWAKRYSLHPDEGPALIGNNTQIPLPQEREVTIERIASDCAHKDPVMKHRTCILEPCLLHCKMAGKD